VNSFTKNIDFSQRIIAIFHSTFVSYYAYQIILTNNFESSGDLYLYVVSHDLYDSLINLNYDFPLIKVVTSLFHHAIVITTLLLSYYYDISLVHTYMVQVVLCEATSPLLDIGKIIMTYYQKQIGYLLIIILPTFITSFAYLRIYNISIIAKRLLYDHTEEERIIVSEEFFIYLQCIVVIFFILQCYWFYLILNKSTRWFYYLTVKNQFYD
jgi:hypothetical protein